MGTLCASATSRSRVNAAGANEQYWRVRRKGDRGYAWTGWGTHAEIELMLARLVASGRTGPSDRGEQRREIGTIAELVQRWWEYQASRPDLAPSTIDNYTKDIRHILAWIGAVLTALVDRGTLEVYRDDRLREGAAPRTVQLELRILRMAWRWGADRGLVPSRELPPVKVRVDGYVINHRTPDLVDIAPVLALLSGPIALVFQLLAITGARVSEICAVRRTDLDRRCSLLTLVGKTGLRVFPLPEEIASSLVRHFEGHDGPLVAGSRKVATQNVRDRLHGACKAAGVESFTPHGFRRMVVDRMARSGVDVATAASLTGHSVEVMLRFYRQVSDEDRRLAVIKAGLGHFPAVGTVIEGRWDDAKAASGGTDLGHNDGK
jgi:integrase